MNSADVAFVYIGFFIKFLKPIDTHSKFCYDYCNKRSTTVVATTLEVY